MLRARGPRLSGLVLLCVVIAGAMALGACSDEQTKTVDIFQPHEYGDWQYDGQADIDGPERVVFGDVLRGETVQKSVEISNAGDDLLKLGRWRVDGPFLLSYPRYDGRPPEELAPGESIQATLTYTARTTDRAQGTLSIESNDPDEPVFEVALFANADFPCLTLTPADALDFGTAELHQMSQKVIIAKNCARRSETTFTVDHLEGASEFSLIDGGLQRQQVTLRPGASARIPIGFMPQAPGQYEGAVFIESNDENQPHRVVNLKGQGRPYDCPQAVIRAYNPDRGEAIADPQGQLNAVPLDNIDLDASQSRDPEGSGIARVQWRIAQRPTDSTNELDNTDQTTSTIWMQLAGTYVVELNVWNGLGVKSCQPARMTLNAIADQDIHIQLVWHTPNDPDQTDANGADLDIHLLHPNGNFHWNLPPWDCFWQNMAPDWGQQGDATDDPSLDIDDIDGAGPENINLDNPESGATYHVGVYYFSDHNYGTSYATVRLYLGGQLAFEQDRKRMTSQEFWHAADIAWPSGHITKIDRLYRSFP